MLKEVDFKKATSEVLKEGKTRQRFEQALQKQNQRKKIMMRFFLIMILHLSVLHTFGGKPSKASINFS